MFSRKKVKERKDKEHTRKEKEMERKEKKARKDMERKEMEKKERKAKEKKERQKERESKRCMNTTSKGHRNGLSPTVRTALWRCTRIGIVMETSCAGSPTSSRMATLVGV